VGREPAGPGDGKLGEKVKVERISAVNWAILSENAHLTVFGKHKPANLERVDYALLVVRDHTPLIYVTCRELDGESLYWQFGGALPGTRGSIHTLRAIQTALDWAQARYKRVTMLVENNNRAMLKMAMKVGFLVVGIRNFQGSILLEHLLEFKKEG
jgi:hypothetical protein